MILDISELSNLLGTEVSIQIRTGGEMYAFIRGTLEAFGDKYVVSNRGIDHTGSSEVMFNAEDIKMISNGSGKGVHVLWFKWFKKSV